MDPKTKYYSLAHQKALANDTKLLEALEKSPKGLRSGQITTLLGYTRLSSVYKVMSDLKVRLLEQGDPLTVNRYAPKKIKGQMGQTLYKLEPRRRL